MKKTFSKIENKNEFKVFEEIADLQTGVKQVRFGRQVGKQGFYYDTRKVF